MLQDLLYVSLNNSKNKSSILEEPLSNLSVSDTSLSNIDKYQRDKYSERGTLLQQLFTDKTVKYLDKSMKISPSVLPIGTANPCSGSISSGQPVVQSSTPNTMLDDTVKNLPTDKKHLLREINKPTGQSNQKSLFVVPSPSSSSSNLIIGSVKGHDAQAKTVIFGSTDKSPSLSFQHVMSTANTNMPKTDTVIKTSSSLSTTPLFSFSSSTTPSTSTAPQTFAIPTSNAAKGFSFTPLSSGQTAFSSPSFGSSAQFSSPSNSPFSSKTSTVFEFRSPTTVVTTASSVISTPSFTTEASKTSSTSIFKVTPAENTSKNTESGIQLPINSSPLTSLSSLVSGIEPLKPSNTQTTIGNATKVIPNQPFIFKSPISGDNKNNSEKDLSSFVPQTAFGSPIPNKTEFRELEGSAAHNEKDSTELKSKLDGVLKKLSFDSTPVKSIFGGSAQQTPPGIDTAKQEQTTSVKSIFGVSTPMISPGTETAKQEQAPSVKSIFGVSSPITSPGTETAKQDQTTSAKSIFGGTIFGGNSQLSPSVTGTIKEDQLPKNTFSFSSPSSNLFGTGKETLFPSQTSVFSTTISSSPTSQKEQIRKTEEASSGNASKIIEISLSSSKSELDPKVSLENLSTKKDLIITKVESLDEKAPSAEGPKPHEPANTSLFPSFSSFETPKKSSQNICSTSSPEKTLPTYEIHQTEDQSGFSTSSPEKTLPTYEIHQTEDQSGLSLHKEQAKAEDLTKQLGKSMTQSTSEVAQPNNMPQHEINKSNKSSAFSFGSSVSTTTTTTSQSSPNTATTQVTTSFSFSQLGTQPTDTSFTFAIPSVTTTTTSSSTFSFGSLSTGSTENKPISEFSFGGQTSVSSPGNIFGGISNKPVGSSSIFGGQPTTQAAASVATTETKTLFGQTSTQQNKNIFGQSPTNPVENKTIFGQPSATSTDTKSIFGQVSTNTLGSTSVFGQTPATLTEGQSIFGQSPSTPSGTKSVFGQTSGAKTEGKSVFGQSLPTSSETKSIFGQTPSTAESKSVFGQTSVATVDSKSVFGQSPSPPAESKSIFGQTPATTADLQSAFSFSLGVSTTSAQSSFFGTPATTAASFFGQPICSPVSTASSPFGQTTSTPGFGNAAQSPFGSTTTFGSKPTFGMSGGSFFGQSSGGFGSNSSSMFGGTSPSMFGGSNTQPNTAFGSAPGGSGGSMFGGGSFSAGGQTVAQTGFGTSGFQNKPAFGSTSPSSFGAPPAFGAAPTFGGSPSFGSPSKLFGNPAPASSAFGSSPQQQSATFESLANQNTMTFGNLAQNQTPAFGSVFSQPQAASPPPAFPPATSASVFGGSSFSSWR